jgi:hypothetical protein
MNCWATIIRPLCGLINLLFVRSLTDIPRDLSLCSCRIERAIEGTVAQAAVPSRQAIGYRLTQE